MSKKSGLNSPDQRQFNRQCFLAMSVIVASIGLIPNDLAISGVNKWTVSGGVIRKNGNDRFHWFCSLRGSLFCRQKLPALLLHVTKKGRKTELL